MSEKSLRTYEENSKQEDFYKEMYKYQTLEYVVNQKKKYEHLGIINMTMNKALELLNTYVDSSDPDVDEPNLIHAFQTAERIRKKYPDDKEYQIIGLIHDLGKVLFTFKEPEWSVTGDTFVVGCKLPSSLVYYNHTENHPDRNNTLLGIYDKFCGLDNLHLSFGHDEYLYQVLKKNKDIHHISEKYWDIIRYHSFYPWHTHGEYMHFMNGKDFFTLNNIKDFNQYDLYSKNDKDFCLTDDVIDYYKDLLNKYFPTPLQW